MMAPIRAPPTTKARRVLKGHFGKITACHWAGDSTAVVTASQDGNLLLWNAVTANKLQSISLKSSYVMSVGIEQSKGNMVACGGLDNLCTVYKFDKPSVAMEMASHDGFLSCCRFLSEEHILTSSGDSTCIRWDIASGRVLDTFAEHEADAMFMSLRPNDPNVFVSCSVDKTVKVWDIRSPKTSQQTLTGHMGDVNGIDFCPADGNTFATCSEDGTARVWDLRAYQEVARFGTLKTVDPNMPDPSGYTSIAFSRSGRLLFCGHSDSNVLAYDVLSDKPTPTFTLSQAHDSHVSCLGVSPNGDALCTGSWDFNLKVSTVLRMYLYLFRVTDCVLLTFFCLDLTFFYLLFHFRFGRNCVFVVSDVRCDVVLSFPTWRVDFIKMFKKSDKLVAFFGLQLLLLVEFRKDFGWHGL
jgi:guanine nucleotide-binding protein G(I)/G(S)/G(T) subunit beta-1